MAGLHVHGSARPLIVVCKKDLFLTAIIKIQDNRLIALFFCYDINFPVAKSARAGMRPSSTVCGDRGETRCAATSGWSVAHELGIRLRPNHTG